MNMEWQPIETAPKDRAILLYRPTAFLWAQVAIGKWENCANNKSHRPYWRLEVNGACVSEARRWVSTHWMPLPPPPGAQDEPTEHVRNNESATDDARDAARYRWLKSRKGLRVAPDSQGRPVVWYFDNWCCSPYDLDATIDAAMA